VGRRVVVVLCALALVPLAGGSSTRAAARYTSVDETIPGAGVSLAATLYTPSGTVPAGGWPAIVLFHGLGGKRQDLDAIAAAFADRFVVLSFDARGHGQSTGQTSIDGPNEMADTRDVFTWLASRPNVDPSRIGAWGISLGGGAVLRSLVEGVPWTAVATAQTWTDLYGALAPQSLSKSGAVFQFLNSVPPVRLDPSVVAIKDDAIASRNLAVLKAFAAARSTRSQLSRVHTPVLFLQGRRDFAFDISQAKAGYKLLQGPKALYVGDFGHAPSSFPGPDLAEVLRRSSAWFTHYLAGGPVYSYRPIGLAPDPWRGKAVSSKTLPATRTVRLAFRGSSRLAAGGTAVRTSGALRTRVEAFGSARVRVKVKLSGGWSRLVAVLTAKRHDVVTVVSEGGINTSAMRGTHMLTIRLLDDATLIPRGSKLTLTLASSSMAQNPNNLLYLNLPMPPGARATIGPARLELPVLRKPVSK
jgi:fermentation-respiration switch protein FrsA (DUF1100 family)